MSDRPSALGRDHLVGGNDLRTLLMCSMRYALGRETYMPVLVQDLMRAYRVVLSAEDCEQLAREIDQHHGRSGSIGADFDTRDWLRFAAWLRDRSSTLLQGQPENYGVDERASQVRHALDAEWLQEAWDGLHDDDQLHIGVGGLRVFLRDRLYEGLAAPILVAGDGEDE